ncbi:MAG: heme-binding domain-containing protein [Bacteroidota bacterium]|nr:heme-binding domain-containing protein [Bacteroidota bacterium]
MFRKIMVFLLAALVVIQFFHPKKNKAEGLQPNYIGNNFAIPANVKTILAKACNDCHSNNTRYPWYAKLQPVHWWLDKHIKKAKKEINFDEYANKSLRYQFHKMEEMIDIIKDGEMPLNYYTWNHKAARLSEEEKGNLIGWANSVMDTMKTKYPIDSLIRKK